MYSVFLNSSLFKGLRSDELNTLLNSVNHRIKNFNSGEQLAQEGEVVDQAMLLMEGRLQGVMVDLAGNSLKIEELNPPQMVASAFLFGPQGKFPVFLSAKTDGKVLLIRKSDFTKMLSSDQRVMVNFINILSGKAQFLSGKITFLSLKTIREKIAYYLLERTKGGSECVIPMGQTQTNLADLFGVTRPSLSRSILELENMGIIVWSKDKVVINDLMRLNEILGR
jgi:CRP-like cAMP-binding protein